MPPEINLREMERRDLELVMAWRCHPEIYHYFRSQTGRLGWIEHIEWFESMPEDAHQYMIEWQGRRVGVTGISEDNELSIYLGDASAREEGIATAAVRWMCEQYEDRMPLTAEVNRNNEASKQLFDKVGFRRVSIDGDWELYEMNH
jgi:hypothetical protein